MFKPNLGHWATQGAHTALEGVKFLFSLPLMWNQDIVAEAIDRLVLAQHHAPGFFNASELEDLFKTGLPSNNFANTDIDLYVTATSLDSHERAVFNGLYNFSDGHNQFITDVPIHKAVRASASIPGMFDPVMIRDRYYIDGEVRQTLSMDIGLALADHIVISHTYHPLYLRDKGTLRDRGWVNILKQALHITFYERISVWKEIYAAQYPDKEVLWIEPDPDDEEFFMAPEFSFRPEVHKLLIQRGERAALNALNRNTTRVKV
jgi:predicted acylesterase/phospholipase RssA